MTFDNLLYEKRNGIGYVTLNRPEKLNAYSEVMVHEILAALADARDDEEIRAVIITGSGRGFCSGGDISRDEERLGHLAVSARNCAITSLGIGFRPASGLS